TLTLALAVGWMLLGAGRTPSPASPGNPPSNPEGSAPQAPEAVTSSAPKAPGAATSATSRLARAAAARERSWRRGFAALGVLVVGLLTASFASRARIPAAEPATALAPEAGAVSFAASLLDDGRMHFFTAALDAGRAGGTGSARFFAIKVSGEVH